MACGPMRGSTGPGSELTLAAAGPRPGANGREGIVSNSCCDVIEGEVVVGGWGSGDIFI